MSPHSRRRVRLTRLAAAGFLAAALGLGAVACGGSSSSGAADPPSPSASTSVGSPAYSPPADSGYLGQASAQARQAFVTCMRHNSEPKFPSTLDPAAMQAAGIDFTSDAYRNAIAACRSKLLG